MTILLTGMTGFIGGYLCQRLIAEHAHTIVALVRPQTAAPRYQRFAEAVRILKTDLTDEAALEHVFARYQFDWVFHLAAVRGGGAASREEFERSNIHATIVLAHLAKQYGVKFMFCSSVGVFGTIPQQLPPDGNTPKIGDNYYHYSKIEAERRLLALQEQGLRLVIIRPIITYGPGDRGFPFQLIHLTARGLLMLPSQDIRIHLVDVQTLVDAFLQAAKRPEALGEVYTVTDYAPVSLKSLVKFISIRLFGKRYPAWKIVPVPILRVAEYGMEHIFKNDTWMTRMKLMSRDWYYDGSRAIQELDIHPKATIPNFSSVIEWYQENV